MLHPVCCHDLELQFFSKYFAQCVFPVPFHGSDRSMHYANWICNKLFPLKQMCFRKIKITNHKHRPHGDEIADGNAHANYLMEKFNEYTFDKSFDPKKQWPKEKLVQQNYAIALKRPDKKEFFFEMCDLYKIYDINNKVFADRASFREKSWLVKSDN